MSKPTAAKASNSLALSAAVAQFLDDAIPLNGASHRDVSEYGVHVPLRNAECYAVTNDGERVGFAQRWNFRGWSGNKQLSSLLFDAGDTLVELLLAGRSSERGSEPVSNINLVSTEKGGQLVRDRYIGIDGHMLRGV